jgi:NitT/TauT family transport system ATP-binding protein
MSRPKIQIIGLHKIFNARSAHPTIVFENINLHIDDGEFMCLVGPSGCGKSTTLLCIAGLESPTSGQILLDGRRVLGPGPDLGVVFQEYALFSWRTVLKNIEYGLEVRGLSRGERTRRAKEMLKLVHLEAFANHRPHQLSGGMKQRVAIARALVMEPQVLLLDEPFGALDALTRRRLQLELLRIWEETKKTIIFVTHSIREAVFLADRVVVLSARPGRIKADVKLHLSRPRDPAESELVAFEKKLESIIWEDIERSGNEIT